MTVTQKKKMTAKERAIYELKEWSKAFVVAFVAAIIIRLFVFETMMVPTGSMIPTIMPGDRLFIEKITYSAREPEIGEIVVFWTPFVDKQALSMLGWFDKFMDLFSPRKFKGHVKYVKRLVGKEGDVLELVEVAGKGYQLYVNGKVPESLKDRYYDKEGVFSDPKFYVKIAFPERTIGNERYLFTQLKQILSYSDYYQEYLKDLNLEEYIWRDPATGRVKVKIPKGFCFMMGDNSKDSLDSRFFGFVPVENIIGQPMLRIWPLNRFGPVKTVR